MKFFHICNKETINFQYVWNLSAGRRFIYGVGDNICPWLHWDYVSNMWTPLLSSPYGKHRNPYVSVVREVSLIGWRRSRSIRAVPGTAFNRGETPRKKLLHHLIVCRRRLPISSGQRGRRYGILPQLLSRTEVRQANFWHNPFYCLARKGRPRGSPFFVLYFGTLADYLCGKR